MNVSYLVVAVLACAVAVFAPQNPTPIDIRFLAWHLSKVPVAVLALVSLAAGLVIAGVPLSIGRWRSRRRVRALQVQVQETQATLADREGPLTTTRGEDPATRSAGSWLHASAARRLRNPASRKIHERIAGAKLHSQGDRAPLEHEQGCLTGSPAPR